MGMEMHEGFPYASDAFYRWTNAMDLGDRPDAEVALAQVRGAPWLDALGAAARASSDGDSARAFAILDAARRADPRQRLDLPAAHLADCIGDWERAAVILQQRFPDLASGEDAINAFNAGPALDLAVAWREQGDASRAHVLVERVARYLDGPSAAQGPPAMLLRSQLYALEGSNDMAMGALEQAYAAGFRTTWGAILVPGAIYAPYPIDDDPRFGTLRGDVRFKALLQRIRADDARQFERMRIAGSGP
jgi:hypothetical protein